MLLLKGFTLALCFTSAYCGSCFESEIDYTGNLVSHLKNIANADKCQEACIKSEPCEHFVYAENRKDCYLKSGEFQKLPQKIATSGPKVCPGCFEDNTDYGGTDIVGSHTTQKISSDCQTACLKNSACKYWTYVEKNGSCFLKSSRTMKITGKDGLVSGPKLCIEQIVVQTSSVSYAGSTDPIIVKLCSDANPNDCCSFKTTGKNTERSELDVYDDTQFGNCKAFTLVGKIEVTITSTGSDGWRGEFISIDFPNQTAKCPVTGWIDEKSSIKFPCETYSTEDFETLKTKYCNMDLDQKRKFLLSDKVTANQAEQLLVTLVQTCKSEKTPPCKHSNEEVLNFPDGGKIEAKIDSQCTGICQEMKKTAEKDIQAFEKEATAILAREENDIGKAVKNLDKLAIGFAKVSAKMIDKATLSEVKKINQQLQDDIKNSGLDDTEKKELLASSNVAAKKDPSRFRTFVESKIKSKQARAVAKRAQVLKKKIAFKANMGKVKKGMKTVGKAGNVAKASAALAGGASALSDFMSCKNPDGSIDGKKLAKGVLGAVGAISTFLPAPASVVTGLISGIAGMFLGGGGPTTEQIIMEEFEKQRKFIEEQFAKQAKLFKNLMTQTELEGVKAKALGVLDALQSRFEFIAVYEGVETCLTDEAISEITQRVEYFMDQSDAASVKHTFNAYCPRLLSQREASDNQQVCGFLLFTYLVIEQKRFEILTVMISLLTNTENFQHLTDGYLNVQSQQKKALTDWMLRTFGVTETYCGLFVYHKDIWNGRKNQMETTLNVLHYFAPDLMDKKSQCINIDCFLSGYDISGYNIGTPAVTRDAGNCQIACSRNALCNYWSFDTRNKKCWMKREAAKITASSAVQSGPKKCLHKIKTESEDFSMYCKTGLGINLSGADPVASMKGSASAASCQLQCQKNPRCIVWIVYNEYCVLKDSWSTIKRNQGSRIYSGMGWCPASLGTCFQPNTNFNTNNIWKSGKEYLPNIPNVHRCQHECQKEWACHIFTYDTKHKRCFLKYSLRDGKNHNVPGSISGWQSCACGRYGAYFSSGPSTTIKKVGNIELCYKLCKFTSSCYAWTYDLNNLNCILNKNSSALKSYMVLGKYSTENNARISGPKDCRLWR